MSHTVGITTYSKLIKKKSKWSPRKKKTLTLNPIIWQNKIDVFMELLLYYPVGMDCSFV